jgi:hypothetical protein
VPIRILAQAFLSAVLFFKGEDYANALFASGQRPTSVSLYSGNEAVFMVHGAYILAQALLFIYFFLIVYSLYIDMKNQLADRVQLGQSSAFLGAAYVQGSTNQGTNMLAYSTAYITN